MNLEVVLNKLISLADDQVKLVKKSKFGIHQEDSLGIYQRDINLLVKEIGRDHELGLELISSGIYEARLLASKIMNPKKITINEVEQWIEFFDTWEIVDTFSMKLFSKSPIAIDIIDLCSSKSDEFELRVTFATLSSLCMADKVSKNEDFVGYLDLIEDHLNDSRNFVKKAVNWALRSLGKRNEDLNQLVLDKISIWETRYNSSSAVWIMKDAKKELRNPNVRISQYPRSLYRK